MGKAFNGDGSIRKRKSGKLAGKWRVQWGYTDPVSNLFVSIDKTFPTHGEAKGFLNDLKTKVRTGERVQIASSKRALTLNTWFDQLAGTKDKKYTDGLWLDDGVTALTVATRSSRYNQHVRKSTLGDMPIQNITVLDVRGFYKTLKQKGKSTATIKDVKAVLVKVVNDAIDTYEKLPNLRNVFSKVEVETPRKRVAVALPIKDAKHAIAHQTSARRRAMLGLYLLGGLRLSEQMALRKEQLDFEKEVIVIDRAVKLDATGKQTVGLPKGGTELDPRARVVVMCPSLAALLRPLMDMPGSYLFPSASADQPRMKKLVYATWSKIKRHGELPDQMVLKDCRLSHNNWIEKLMPTVSTSTRLEHMGHSTAQRDELNKGLGVNLANYTRHLSEAHKILRDELEAKLGLGGLEMAELDADDFEEVEVQPYKPTADQLCA